MKPDLKRTRISLIEAVRDIPKLSTPERCMMFVLASYANPDGTSIYPSQELLAKILEVSDRQVRNLLSSLEKGKHLIPDGRQGYHKKYRLNIPGITPTITTTPDISREEWESQWLPEEADSAVTESPSPHTILEDDEPTDKFPVVRARDDDATVKTPVVKPPDVPTTPPAAPPGPTPEEKLQRDLAVMEESLDLVRRGIMNYDQFMRGGRRKGFSDDYLNWRFSGGGGDTGSPGSQPERDPESSITNIPSGTYQP